jgi:hypothetical protein
MFNICLTENVFHFEFNANKSIKAFSGKSSNPLPSVWCQFQKILTFMYLFGCAFMSVTRESME